MCYAEGKSLIGKSNHNNRRRNCTPPQAAAAISPSSPAMRSLARSLPRFLTAMSSAESPDPPPHARRKTEQKASSRLVRQQEVLETTLVGYGEVNIGIFGVIRRSVGGGQVGWSVTHGEAAPLPLEGGTLP